MGTLLRLYLNSFLAMTDFVRVVELHHLGETETLTYYYRTFFLTEASENGRRYYSAFNLIRSNALSLIRLAC